MSVKIISVFGTRPEAIKMAPVLKELKKHPTKIISKVVVTAQHREMLDQVLKIFRISPDYDLNIMQPEQTLSQISTNILKKIDSVLKKENPDLVLVQGDTPTAFVSALSSFYHKIPVGHVEAGLRTYNKYDPFPEEMNRQLIDVLCDLYFVHTDQAKRNLLNEGKDEKRIFVTGNTVIDALLWASRQNWPFSNKELKNIDFDGGRVILVTTHRRENWGGTMGNIHKALLDIIEANKNAQILFPVHLNPKVQNVAKEILADHPRVHLIRPLDYQDMVSVLKRVHIVMTDSGGLQEEAPALGKPVLVIRRTTERPEGIVAGTAKLVGINPKNIIKEAEKLLNNKDAYKKMAKAVNPYGDGKASERIVKIILNQFKL